MLFFIRNVVDKLLLVLDNLIVFYLSKLKLKNFYFGVGGGGGLKSFCIYLYNFNRYFNDYIILLLGFIIRYM